MWRGGGEGRGQGGASLRLLLLLVRTAEHGLLFLGSAMAGKLPVGKVCKHLSHSSTAERLQGLANLYHRASHPRYKSPC